MKGVGDSKSKKQTVHPGKFLPATRGIPGERSAFASIVTRFSKPCQIKRNIEVIRGLLLGEEAKEKILGGNAGRILGLDLAPQTR